MGKAFVKHGHLGREVRALGKDGRQRFAPDLAEKLRSFFESLFDAAAGSDRDPFRMARWGGGRPQSRCDRRRPTARGRPMHPETGPPVGSSQPLLDRRA